MPNITNIKYLIQLLKLVQVLFQCDKISASSSCGSYHLVEFCGWFMPLKVRSKVHLKTP